MDELLKLITTVETDTDRIELMAKIKSAYDELQNTKSSTVETITDTKALDEMTAKYNSMKELYVETFLKGGTTSPQKDIELKQESDITIDDLFKEDN